MREFFTDRFNFPHDCAWGALAPELAGGAADDGGLHHAAAGRERAVPLDPADAPDGGTIQGRRSASRHR